MSVMSGLTGRQCVIPLMRWKQKKHAHRSVKLLKFPLNKDYRIYIALVITVIVLNNAKISYPSLL